MVQLVANSLEVFLRLQRRLKAKPGGYQRSSGRLETPHSTCDTPQSTPINLLPAEENRCWVCCSDER
ncbi:unnamed protein product [Gadus morhua 'NCC']